jgi:HSP20 family protein
MAVVRWEPFRELAALQNEMGRFMNQMWGSSASGAGNGGTWLPALDAWETQDELVLALDLPGIPEEQVSIEIDDDVLTVSGERERTVELTGERFSRFERRYGTFARSVTLPQGVSAEDIVANVENGVLEIHVPKPQERKPRRIQIGAKGTIEGESETGTIEGEAEPAA